MANHHPEFDRSRLTIEPLSERAHDLDISQVVDPVRAAAPEPFPAVGGRVVAARKRGSSVALLIGAHVIRAGAQKYIIDLMERGFVSCVAMSGAGVIHDYEFSLIGATTESVSRYIREGRFGLWRETGRINDIVADAAREKIGVGEAVGRAIESGALPHRDVSILAAGCRLGIPVTVHVGIGYDIVHEHPNCDGAAWGAASYTDFLRFTHVLEKLEGGVAAVFGSAVMAPEVFLKALAMVRNAAHQEGGKITDFTTLVCDVRNLEGDFDREPPRDHPDYYFRPWKTLLVRTVADGGSSFYVRGRHAETIPHFWNAVVDAAEGKTK